MRDVVVVRDVVAVVQVVVVLRVVVVAAARGRYIGDFLVVVVRTQFFSFCFALTFFLYATSGNAAAPLLPLSFCHAFSLCTSRSPSLCARQFNLKPFSINLQ